MFSRVTYEVCPKSNETVVIKVYWKLLKYTKVKDLQSNLLPLVNSCAFAFSMIQNILGRHFLGSSWAPSSRPFWWNRCQKNEFLSEQIWSWGRRKSPMGPDRGNMGCSKVAMFLSARNWQILRAVWARASSWWSAHALASQRLRLLSRTDLTRRRRISL